MYKYRTECAWCDTFMGVKISPTPIKEISHGICTSCYDKYFPELDKIRAKSVVVEEENQLAEDLCSAAIMEEVNHD